MTKRDTGETRSAREHLLEAAERLFTEHGFAAVKLRDLEQAVGIHHATFYHHVPGGKTQLYVEAIERSLERHASALETRLKEHRGDLKQQLRSAVQWVLANPAGNHTRMLSTDLKHLPPKTAKRVAARAYKGLVGPIEAALREASERKEIDLGEAPPALIAGALLASIQALQTAHAQYPGDRPVADLADALIKVFLRTLPTVSRSEAL